MVKDMLSEYKTTIKRLRGIQKQLDEFVDESENGKILLSIPGIGVMNASALLAAIDKGCDYRGQPTSVYPLCAD
jgi:transposase